MMKQNFWCHPGDIESFEQLREVNLLVVEEVGAKKSHCSEQVLSKATSSPCDLLHSQLRIPASTFRPTVTINVGLVSLNQIYVTFSYWSPISETFFLKLQFSECKSMKKAGLLLMKSEPNAANMNEEFPTHSYLEWPVLRVVVRAWWGFKRLNVRSKLMMK